VPEFYPEKKPEKCPEIFSNGKMRKIKAFETFTG
jgi:hypothetical protein